MQTLKYFTGTGTTLLSGSTQGGGFKLAGWNITETAGGAAVVNLRDGTSGPIVAQANFPATANPRTVNAAPGDWYINLKSGNLQVEVVSGAVQWDVYQA